MPVSACSKEFSNPGVFGITGMAAANGTVVIADSCADSIAGKLYVYSFNNNGGDDDDDDGGGPPLTLQAVIPHPDGTPGDAMGSHFANGRQTVDTDGSRILAGTPLGDRGIFGEEGGDTFLFQRSGSDWNLSARLESNLEPDDRVWFGQNVIFLDNDALGVGEMDAFGLGGGRLFIYESAPDGGGDDDDDD